MAEATIITPIRCGKRGGSFIIVCAGCKKQFVIQRCALGRRVFCSKQCKDRSEVVTVDAEYIRKMSAVDPTSGCWVWRGSIGSRGYPRVISHGELIPVHRMSYELAYGPLKPNTFACHKCDNPACVNPDHLFEGTALDNNRDRKNKGRSAKGFRSPNAKLTAESIELIRQLRQAGTFINTIAARIGVHKNTIRNVLEGTTYQDTLTQDPHFPAA